MARDFFSFHIRSIKKTTARIDEETPRRQSNGRGVKPQSGRFHVIKFFTSVGEAGLSLKKLFFFLTCKNFDAKVRLHIRSECKTEGKAVDVVEHAETGITIVKAQSALAAHFRFQAGAKGDAFFGVIAGPDRVATAERHDF